MLQESSRLATSAGGDVDEADVVEIDRRSTPAIHSVPGTSQNITRIVHEDLVVLADNEREIMLRTIEAKDNAMLAMMKREAVVSRKMYTMAQRALRKQLAEQERSMAAERVAHESQDALLRGAADDGVAASQV